MRGLALTEYSVLTLRLDTVVDRAQLVILEMELAMDAHKRELDARPDPVSMGSNARTQLLDTDVAPVLLDTLEMELAMAAEGYPAMTDPAIPEPLARMMDEVDTAADPALLDSLVMALLVDAGG
jgi:hypothetical protein